MATQIRPEARFDDVYHSMSQRAVAALAQIGAAASTPFTIEVRFVGGLTDSQKGAFAAAADRWTRVIIGDLPSVTVSGEVIDDLVILAQGANIDGPGQVLGQAGPTYLRPATAGNAAFLPAKGTMTFDTADLAEMERQGTLLDVITHEMGHVLGIGTVWARKGLLIDPNTNNPTFQGQRAMQEYGLLKGTSAAPVPVENVGGQGTANSHWRETVFRNELMSGYIAGPNNPLSRVTVASLGDIGYDVDIDAADPFAFSNLFELAEAGLLAANVEDNLGVTVLPIIPTVLPESSLA